MARSALPTRRAVNNPPTAPRAGKARGGSTAAAGVTAGRGPLLSPTLTAPLPLPF